MPENVIMRTSDRTIAVRNAPQVNGQFVLPDDETAPPGQPAYQVVQISDAEVAKFAQAGVYTLDQSNAVVVSAPPTTPLAPDEQARVTSRSDLNTAYTTALARLDAIEANLATYTAAQQRDALHDTVVIVRYLLKFTKANLV